MKICGEEGSESDYDYPDGLLLPPLPHPPSWPGARGLTVALGWIVGQNLSSESQISPHCVNRPDNESSEGQTHPAGQGTAGPPLPAPSPHAPAGRDHHNILLDIFSLCFAPVSVVLWLWAANDICLAEWWSANWCRPDGPSSLAWLLWGNWDVTWPGPAPQAACLISLIIPW